MSELRPVNDFSYVSYAQEVIFAPGALAKLGEAVDRMGVNRLMLCASRSMQRGGFVGAIQATLGNRLVIVRDDVFPHVQDVQFDEMLGDALVSEVDAVIGLGGGSPIGMAKAVAFGLEEKRIGKPARAPFSTAQPLVPAIAIPTTYAGSEMTPVYGITHTRETPPRKVTVSNPKIAAKLVIYDPNLTLGLPPEMTASTGINALAHCIEALYSTRRHPLSTAVALQGLRYIQRALPACYRDGQNLEARSEMLAGAHLAGLSLASVTMGLHHGLCHVLGGTANVPHGIANSIILPYAIRFNADVTAAQLLPAAEIMGIAPNGASPEATIESLAQKIFDLTGSMHLPQRLRDANVKGADLPELAQLGFQNRTVQNNPKPVKDAAQIEALLRAAW
jgi:alcohol dehydrogenase class IV